MDLVAQNDELTVDMGPMSGSHRFEPLSDTQFVDSDDLDIRLQFPEKGRAEISGLPFTTKPIILESRTSAGNASSSPMDKRGQSPRRSNPDINPSTIVEDLRTELDSLAAQGRFSGTVLVAQGDKTLFEHAYGMADRKDNSPNRIDTKFSTASLAKIFTATAILQLAGEGKFSLDDKLAKVLPNYPNAKIASRITVRQLLTHTSGLVDVLGPEMVHADQSKLKRIADWLPLQTNLSSSPPARVSRIAMPDIWFWAR